jgi:hypothetical protein
MDISGNTSQAAACPLCNEAFTAESKKAESFACACVYHTACLAQKLLYFSYSYIHMGQDLNCPCGAVVAAASVQPTSLHGGDTDDEAPPVTAPPNTPEYRADVKRLREKHREYNKAKTAYKGLISQKKRAFKEQIAPHIATIREAKKQILTGLRQDPIARTLRGKKSGFAIAKERFRTKHKIKRRDFYTMFPTMRERSRWRSSMPYMIARGFRVRL